MSQVEEFTIYEGSREFQKFTNQDGNSLLRNKKKNESNEDVVKEHVLVLNFQSPDKTYSYRKRVLSIDNL